MLFGWYRILRYQLGQLIQVLTDVGIQPCPPVLHNEPRVGQGNDFLKPAVFPVQGIKELQILTFPDAVAAFLIDAQVNKF